MYVYYFNFCVWKESRKLGPHVQHNILPVYSTARHWDVQYYSDTHCDVPALQVKVVEYKGRSAYTLLECPSVFSVTGCRGKKVPEVHQLQHSGIASLS